MAPRIGARAVGGGGGRCSPCTANPFPGGPPGGALPAAPGEELHEERRPTHTPRPGGTPRPRAPPLPSDPAAAHPDGSGPRRVTTMARPWRPPVASVAGSGEAEQACRGRAWWRPSQIRWGRGKMRRPAQARTRTRGRGRREAAAGDAPCVQPHPGSAAAVRPLTSSPATHGLRYPRPRAWRRRSFGYGTVASPCLRPAASPGSRGSLFLFAASRE
ncbi:hypothetical protein PVAP13_5NG158062 [Panicum virgatum]|uniref:Uncharacterized protein n=1 Tax=Panicum virgatum TaxID=38727 RepID=A0A8T0RTU1_PANVG|nr:hypothetical protein PVAP13_5NG158062 [Panicum virgatum]